MQFIIRILRKIEYFVYTKIFRIHDFFPKMRYRTRIMYMLVNIQHSIFTKLLHMDIHPTARVNIGAKIDKVNSRGIHIGEESYVAPGAVIFAHDFARSLRADTTIGKRCFIGTNAIIMAGITVGDEVIVGSGAVVTKNVPSNCIVAGNPARIIREGIQTEKYGKLKPEQ